MDRIDIIQIVGREFLISNIENNEFSYQQVIERTLSGHYKLDIRFYDSNSETAVLIETKRRFNNQDKQQLFDYVALEQELNPETNIIAILANTDNDEIKVWKVANNEVSEIELSDTKLKSFEEYKMYFIPQNVNDRNAVLENTSKLNKLLHDNGIPEKLRSQFVGTCLLALKEKLKFKGLSTNQINAGIKEILSGMLENSMDRATKLSLLQRNVLESQSVSSIDNVEYQKILLFIKKNILPYINEFTYEGHDILSYFFTTFNKYVAREDKNQAFTPNHIAHFMCRLGGIHRNTRVLDPTCGSGTFLVQAMSQILKECETAAEKKQVKEHQIYGIEFDENVYGLATTNMLIHGDGNSNIQLGSCFAKRDWIESSNINLVLMNPPYNAAKNQVPQQYVRLFGSKSTDPTKGFGFVQFIADTVNQGRLLTLLPMACALTSSSIITDFKRKMLQNHTLDAVFSLPADMFYPGASAVAVCMVFNLGQPHPSDYETFFGYYRNDGFEKRKGVGRVDIYNKWEEIENEWLNLYRHRTNKPGYSVNKIISPNDEWCAEAYLESDYSIITKSDFISKIKDFIAFQIRFSKLAKTEISSENNYGFNDFNVNSWKWFRFGDIVERPYKAKAFSAQDLTFVKYDNPDSIRYVTRTDDNNGVKGFVVNEDFSDVEDGNAIIIGDTTSTIYYQEDDFICGDHIVVIRYPKINKYNALFLVSILNLERFRYSYGKSFKMDSISNTKIKLPSDLHGNPNWEYMENYIKSLPFSSNL